jgi:CDP-diacylglycerol--glycerol-3-phosphate 3-phosphatidyltransferase
MTTAQPTFFEQLRQRSRALLSGVVDPMVTALQRLGVTPNQITILGLLASVGAGALLWTDHLVWGGILVLAGSAIDLLDGALARRTNRATKLGAFLDSNLDRVSEAAIFFGLLAHFIGTGEQEEALLTVAVLVWTSMVSYVKARAEGLGYPCTSGIVTRPERIILVGAGLISGAVTAFLYITAILSFVTACQRFLEVWRQGEKPAR